MKYPLVICTRNTLIIASESFFDGIGKLDPSSGTLRMNVARKGKAGFEWMIDADGILTEFFSDGLLPGNLIQRLGLTRPQEELKLSQGREISAGELLERIANLRDQFDEAPNVKDLKAFLQSFPLSHVLGSADMRNYLHQ